MSQSQLDKIISGLDLQAFNAYQLCFKVPSDDPVSKKAFAIHVALRDLIDEYGKGNGV